MADLSSFILSSLPFFQQNKLLLDVNIEGAWKQGITGKGVVVAILDDGM